MMTAMGAGWCLNGSKCPQIPPVLSTLTYYLLTHCDRRWPGQQLRPAGGRLLLLSVLNSKHITSVWKETEQSQSQPHLNTTNSPAPFKTTAITSTHFQKYKMQYEYNDEMKTHRKCLKCYVYLFSNKKQTMKTCNDRVYVGKVHNLGTKAPNPRSFLHSIKYCTRCGWGVGDNTDLLLLCGACKRLPFIMFDIANNNNKQC